MAEAAAAAAAPPTPAATGTGGTPAVGSAGATLTSIPAGYSWFSGFKNEEVKTYVSQKGFKTTEDLATSFFNLEKLKGVPEDRLLKLPEKMEGAEARAIWERLGAPKEPKGYELPRDEKVVDPKFADFAEGMFHENNLTKAQAHGIIQKYNEWSKNEMQTQIEQRKTAIAQAEQTLQTEWGQHYDKNVNLAKQGAKVLGLDAKTLDLFEAIQGRDVLFKQLQKIGVSVGESNFVAGGTPASTSMTPEQAQSEIQKLMQDKKFVKRVSRGDSEATARWNDLNKLAAPGEKSIG